MLDTLSDIHPLLPTLAPAIGLLVIAVIADLIAGQILKWVTHFALQNTRSSWDDALVEQKAFRWLAQIVPGLVLYYGIPLVPQLAETTLGAVLTNVTLAYIALVATMAIASVLRAANQIYESTEMAKDRPIKGFIQLGIVIVYIVGAILIISALIDRSPLILLSGFGAMTAVLLLVFKDTLLSLVASIQLTGQDMLNVGDWLEMPDYNADGDVIDIGLYTVTVQNWDKTITRIPTHALITHAFKNWRGMAESGGRRIKRSLFVDIDSIRFLSENEVDRFKEITLLHDYILSKKEDISAHRNELGLTDGHGHKANSRHLTNVGTFRAYIVNYLRNNPNIHQDMTLIVRQLEPTPEGLPIQIYAFSNNTNWAAYEDIQADIFDHILAVTPEFGLRIFQQPTGSDFRAALTASSA